MEVQTLTQSKVYVYNGQRIKKTEGSDTDYYFYENGVVSVIEDSSSVTAANLLTNEGGLVGSFRGNTYHNYLTDVQGSTTNIIKEDGTLSAAYDYTDFGETTELTGKGFDNQVCYTGGIYDEETGLQYLNARYYDPETGRFISQDSYRGELDDPGQWHLYAYCANNPINCVDPSGHIRVVTWKKSNKTLIRNHWVKPISPWAKVKECDSITIKDERSVSAHIEGSLGSTVKEVSINVGLGASTEKTWSTEITLKVNKKSKKKYVRAVLKADANKWTLTKTIMHVGPTGIYSKVTKTGSLYKYKSNSVSYELQYSNKKK